MEESSNNFTIITKEDTKRENVQPVDDRPLEELSFAEREKRRKEEKRKKKEEAIEKKRKEEEEDTKRREKEKKVVEFHYYIDISTIAIIGLVFFITCLTGLVYGVSPKGLSLRAIVSVALASIVVYICRSIAKKFFHPDAEDKEGEKK